MPARRVRALVGTPFLIYLSAGRGMTIRPPPLFVFPRPSLFHSSNFASFFSSRLLSSSLVFSRLLPSSSLAGFFAWRSLLHRPLPSISSPIFLLSRSTLAGVHPPPLLCDFAHSRVLGPLAVWEWEVAFCTSPLPPVLTHHRTGYLAIGTFAGVRAIGGGGVGGRLLHLAPPAGPARHRTGYSAVGFSRPGILPGSHIRHLRGHLLCLSPSLGRSRVILHPRLPGLF